jgi:catecholate siderophore receptor
VTVILEPVLAGVQLSGYNLAHKYYYANSYFSSPAENHVVPGAGHYALLTVTLGF